MHFIGGLNKITIVILAMTNLLFLFFILFCPFILNAFPAPESRSSAQPSVYSWSECDIQNGVVKMTNVCKRLLLCFETELAFGNAKVGMRFYSYATVANEKAIFGECAAAMDGKEWHGLIIAKDTYGQFTIQSSLGFSEVLDIDHVNEMKSHTEIALSEVFNNGFTLPLAHEFQKAIHLGAFMGDFGGIATHILAKALFSCGQNGTGLCKKKCLFDPVATLREHLGTNLMEIAFPAEGVSKFALNITAIPFWIACDSKSKDNPCMAAPTTKCNESIGLVACYKSVKNWPAINNGIAKLCQKHLDKAQVAGFAVKTCIHRDQSELIADSLLRFSFSDTTYKSNFTTSFEDAYTPVPVFFIEFGMDQQQSTIWDEQGRGREGKPIERMGNEDVDIGAVLGDIATEMINGTLAKVLYFVPPNNVAKMRAFFQTFMPKYSKLIGVGYGRPNENDPINYLNAEICDDFYRDDCEEIKQLLYKIAALKHCEKSTPVDQSMFDMPTWAPTAPIVKKSPDPLETLICEEDMACNKTELKETYNRLKIACGLAQADDTPPSQSSAAEHRRQKRQYKPNWGKLGKWTKFPIKIRMDPNLNGKLKKWKHAAETGAKLIMEKTCVRFEFVDVKAPEKVGENGILIGEVHLFDQLRGVCGHSYVGKEIGWQKLALSLDSPCNQTMNMFVVAGHELMHALGFHHEQSRSDARNFVTLRHEDTQSKVYATENFDLDYDFGSVMHYEGYGHEERLYEIITLPRFYQQTIGQREEISFKDAAMINRVYCKDSCQNHTDMCKNGGYLNPNDCAKCLCPDGYGGDHCDALEENENCVDLTGNAREFEANQSTQVLKPKIKCTDGGSKCQCHWRIKPTVGKMAVVQFKRLNAGFDCTHNCSLAYVEVKYRTDKRTRGAKLCCPDAFISVDAVSSEYKNWIETRTPDTDIVISARIASSAPMKLNEDEPLFELTYQTRDAKLVSSSKCISPENLFVGKRNPGTGGVRCREDDETDCTCNGDPVCLSEEKWPGKWPKYIVWRCPIIKINGIQVNETVGQNKEHFSKQALGSGITDNWNFALIRCYMAESGSKSFWGFREKGITDVIRVDEIHCLLYEAVGVTPPMRLKSVGDGEKQREEEGEEWPNGKGTVFIIEAESNP